MCLVEVGFKQPDGTVRMMPKPQAGCTLPASEGMVVFTDSQAVHRDRKGVLEFLLINHPLDCPICDRGGECPLQNNTVAYGPSTSRFVEMKRHAPKAFPLSKYVTLDLERCIQCGRCVRFTEEISGDAQLAFRFRGAEMQPSTFQLTDFESKFSGNVIEICPVGALTSAKYRFRARPWDLETRPGLCTVTSCGTNVWFDYRAGKFVRINGRVNEDVNEEWTSDRTKFGHDFYNDPGRLTAPNKREGDGFVRTSWAQASGEIAQAFSEAGAASALLVGPNVSNETMFVAQSVMREVFGSANIDHRSGPHFAKSKDRLNMVQSRIVDFERVPNVFVFGISLADDLPMTFLRVRKGWFKNGNRVVVAHSSPTEVDDFAAAVLRYNPGSEETLAKGLADLCGGKGKAAQIAKDTGVNEAQLEAAVEILKASGGAFVTSDTLANVNPGAVSALANLASATGNAFNCYGLHANSAGAMELGILPDSLPGGVAPKSSGLNTAEILQGCVDGKIKALWLLNFDPITDFHDPELAARALESVDFLAVASGLPSEAMAYASVIVPMSLPAEQDGTYTNCEKRVQRMQQILQAPGESKPGWRIVAEVAMRVKPGTPYFNAGEIMDELAAAVPSFAVARYSQLPGEGALLPLGEKGATAKAGKGGSDGAN